MAAVNNASRLESGDQMAPQAFGILAVRPSPRMIVKRPGGEGTGAVVWLGLMSDGLTETAANRLSGDQAMSPPSTSPRGVPSTV